MVFTVVLKHVMYSLAFTDNESYNPKIFTEPKSILRKINLNLKSKLDLLNRKVIFIQEMWHSYSFST